MIGKIFNKNFFLDFDQYLKEILVMVFMMLISSLLVMSFPLVIKIIIDNLLINNIEFKSLYMIVALFIGITILGQIISLITKYFLDFFVNVLTLNLKSKLFSKLLKIKIRELYRYTDGELLSLFNLDVNTIRNFLVRNFFLFFSCIFSIIIIFVILSTLNLKLTFLTFSLLPLYCITLILSKNFLAKRYKELRTLKGECQHIVYDNLKNAILTKIFNNFIRQEQKYLIVENHVLKKQMQIIILTSILKQLSSVFSLLSSAIILIIGSKQVTTMELSIGSLIVFYSYLNRIYSAFTDLVNINMGYEDYRVSSENISKFFQIEEEFDEASSEIDFDNLESISFNNLGYSINNKVILRDINFHIHKGEKIALFGKNGSGKTTILNLLFKLDYATTGNILLGNKNIVEIDTSYLRQNISYITQKDYFYDDTIYHNIFFSKHEEDLYFYDKPFKTFIDSLSLCENTELGKTERILSGGQERNLSLHRLFTKQAKIVLLDEPFTSLDMKSVMNYREIFNEYFKDVTVVYTTHNKDFLSWADKIIYIEDGEMIINKEELNWISQTDIENKLS